MVDAAETTNGTDGRVLAARLAQGLAGGLTAWSIVIQLSHWPHLSGVLLVFSALALLLSVKKTDNRRSRAFFCFGAGSLLASILLWYVGLGFLRLVLLGDRDVLLALIAEAPFLLVAAALFAFAGAFFWVTSTPSTLADEA